MSKVIEGYMPYANHKTYYRIVEPDCMPSKPPLLCLHGGPGSTHNYFEVFDVIADIDNRTVIMYDQIGCGKSYLDGMGKDFWVPSLWMNELCHLIDYLDLNSLHILGQSWGGMMAILYALDYSSSHVLSYILSSTNPSSRMWEEEGKRRIRLMNPEDQAAIQLFNEGDITEKDPGYIHAVYNYMVRYCYPNKRRDLPECVTRPKRSGEESYRFAWGSNEFSPTGPLAQFEYLDRLHEIKQPCMICSGNQDLCSPLIAKSMYDRIPNSVWNLYSNAHHMCFIDAQECYLSDLIEWLNTHDA